MRLDEPNPRISTPAATSHLAISPAIFEVTKISLNPSVFDGFTKYGSTVFQIEPFDKNE